jgi:hypothetical protein
VAHRPAENTITVTILEVVRGVREAIEIAIEIDAGEVEVEAVPPLATA